MNKQNKNRFIDTEDKLEIMVARWEGVVGGSEGIKKYNWQLWNSHRDVKYRIGNMVNNIVITMVQGGYKAFWEDNFINYQMSNHYALTWY